MSENIWCLRPQYVNEFKCDGSKCGALCCRSDWSIYVDAATYEKYSALQGVIEHLRPDPSGDKYVIEFDGKKVCPFLEDNLCRLQRAHGEDYLSRVCTCYPRINTRFDNFIELALSPTCPVAAELILLAEEPLQFEVVEADEKLLRLGANHILEGVPQELAPMIFGVQLIMISILQERRLTINQRLVVLGFFLDRIENLLCNGELNGLKLRSLAKLYSSESFKVEQVPRMLASNRFNEAAHKQFMQKVTAKLFGEPLARREEISVAKFSTLMENFLVNEIILNVFPWRVDGSIAKNFGVFVTVYKILERLAISKGVRSVEEFVSLVSDFSHEIDHSDDYILQIAELVEGDMLKLLETLLRV